MRKEGGWRYGRDWAPEGGVKKTTLTLTSHIYTHMGHVYFSICVNVSHQADDIPKHDDNRSYGKHLPLGQRP